HLSWTCGNTNTAKAPTVTALGMAQPRTKVDSPLATESKTLLNTVTATSHQCGCETASATLLLPPPWPCRPFPFPLLPLLPLRLRGRTRRFPQHAAPQPPCRMGLPTPFTTLPTGVPLRASTARLADRIIAA